MELLRPQLVGLGTAKTKIRNIRLKKGIKTRGGGFGIENLYYFCPKPFHAQKYYHSKQGRWSQNKRPDSGQINTRATKFHPEKDFI